MSYYADKIEELREQGAKIQELGDEVAIINDDHVIIGGDCPLAYEGNNITPDQARKLGELANKPLESKDDLRRYKEYVAELGLIDSPWD